MKPSSLARTSIAIVLLCAVVSCRKTQGDEPQPAASVVATSTAHGKKKPHRDPPQAHAQKHPDLTMPELSAHAASQDIGGAPTTEHPCGTAHAADGERPLECIDEATTKIDEAASPVIAHATLAGGSASTLPSRVDHRLDGIEGAVRNQGATSACTGFSLASTMDAAAASALGRPGDVSVLHLWSRYAITNMGNAIRENKDKPLAEEPTWPYDANAANVFMHAASCKSGKLTGAACNTKPDLAPQHVADEHPYVTLTGVTKVDSSSTDALERKLAGGKDIWFCAKIAGHLSCGKKGCNLDKMAGSDDVYVRDFDAKGTTGGHCMSLAGYQKTARGTYFLIHNSWGEKWGNKGYAFMHEKTFLQNVEKGATYVVDVKPSNAAAKSIPSGQLASKGCDGDMLKDSHTGECEEPCPDGSARHDGVCGQTSACDAGQINVTGKCVTAAPTSHGTDAASGVSWTCAPGACSYTIPKGKIGCNEDHCSITCAAPAFVLANGTNGPTCTP